MENLEVGIQNQFFNQKNSHCIITNIAEIQTNLFRVHQNKNSNICIIQDT